jgi:hypothetical protein
MSEPSTPAEAGERLAALAPQMPAFDRLQLYTIMRRNGLAARQARQLCAMSRRDAAIVYETFEDLLTRLDAEGPTT